MADSLLGIDFGLARVGTALSFGTLAEPLEVVANDDSLWERLQNLIRQHHISRIIVGVSENEMAQRSQAFGAQLRERFGLPVEFADETLSSAEVERFLRETRGGKRQHRGPIDHFAAALILQRYLDDQPAEGVK